MTTTTRAKTRNFDLIVGYGRYADPLPLPTITRGVLALEWHPGRLWTSVESDLFTACVGYLFRVEWNRCVRRMQTEPEGSTGLVVQIVQRGTFDKLRQNRLIDGWKAPERLSLMFWELPGTVQANMFAADVHAHRETQRIAGNAVNDPTMEPLPARWYEPA